MRIESLPRIWGACLIVALGTLSANLARAWIVIDGGPSFLPPSQTPAELPELSSATERQLVQIDALISADALDEALSALDELLAKNEGGFLELENGTHADLRRLVHRRIAAGPPEMRAAYRGRVDSTAESLWNDALSTHNETPLRRIVDEYFCSSRGDDALLRLGEFALERGDADSARRWWLMLSPRMTDPSGRAWGAVADATQIVEQAEWLNKLVTAEKQIPAHLAYPDSDIAEADILARLATASIRAGELARARAEIALIKLWHPGASGRLGGRDTKFVAALEAMLAAADNWPPRDTPPAWSHPLGPHSGAALAPALGQLRGVAWASNGLTNAAKTDERFDGPATNVRVITGNPAATISVPVVWGESVLYHRDGILQAVRLATGEPSFVEGGAVFREAAATSPQIPFPRERRRMVVQQFGGGVVIRGGVVVQGGFDARLGGLLGPPQIDSRLHGPVSIDGAIAYALLGPRAAADDDPTPRLANPRRRLLGLDLARQGLIAWEAELPSTDHAFSGPPMPTDAAILAPIRNDTTGELFVAAYDKGSARQRWMTKICQSSPSASLYRAAGSDFLRGAGHSVYLDTGEGLVVALDRTTGEVVWTFSYELQQSDRPNNLLNQGRGMPGALTVTDGLVVFAPRFAPALYALDAATGQLVWQSDEAWDVDALLGVADGRLVATGKRLWILDVRTGQTDRVWPESTGAGITGMGRGCIAGEEIFWPTKDTIYVVNLAGEQTRLPIDLQPAGAGQGAVLVPTGNHLLISTTSGITALGPNSPAAPPDEEQHVLQ